MQNASIKMAIIIMSLSLHCTSGYCNVKLIKSGMMKDGGTRCVEYEKDGTLVKCCIDGRLTAGTRDVFIGGYPGAENSKIITKKEMKAVYDDIAEIMKSEEYKRYIAMTDDEMRALIRIDNHNLDKQKTQEHGIAGSYRSLASFKRDLFIRLLLVNWYLWTCTFLAASFYLYRRLRRKTS